MGWKTIGFDCLASLLTILSHASFFSFFLISILSQASCGYELLNAICAYIDKDSIIFLIVGKVWENHMILYFFKWCKKRAIS